MSRGGSREGAGRPAGVRNIKTLERLEAIAASGETPLDYLLRVMRDEGNEMNVRLDAAKSAAPYIHSKLATIDNIHQGPDGGPVRLLGITGDIPTHRETE